MSNVRRRSFEAWNEASEVRRHDEGSYNALRKAVRERYEASDSAIFGWKTLDDDGVNELRQGIAEDLAYLVERYRRNKDHNSRSTYLMLVKVFEQQCEVVAGKVEVKKKTGGNIICNPSDPDATFDGHKGSGYQVQLSETYSADNSTPALVHGTSCCLCMAPLVVWHLLLFPSRRLNDSVRCPTERNRLQLVSFTGAVSNTPALVHGTSCCSRSYWNPPPKVPVFCAQCHLGVSARFPSHTDT